MKVKVYAPGFCNFTHIDEDGFVEMKEGSTVGDLFKKIEVPFVYRPLPIYKVNYKKAGLNTVLNEGDVVSFLSIIAGG